MYREERTGRLLKVDIFVNLILVVEYIFTLKNTASRAREKKGETVYRRFGSLRSCETVCFLAFADKVRLRV